MKGQAGGPRPRSPSVPRHRHDWGKWALFSGGFEARICHTCGEQQERKKR